MTDGEKLKEIREQLRLNQAEMAEKMGIQQKALSHLELGRNSEMRYGSFKSLVNNCKVNPYYLLSDNPNEPMFAPFDVVGMRKRLNEYDKLVDKLLALRISEK